MRRPSQPVAELDEAEADGETAETEQEVEDVSHDGPPMREGLMSCFGHRNAMRSPGARHRKVIGVAARGGAF